MNKLSSASSILRETVIINHVTVIISSDVVIYSPTYLLELRVLPMRVFSTSRIRYRITAC
jgi:hypothetical protein